MEMYNYTENEATESMLSEVRDITFKVKRQDCHKILTSSVHHKTRSLKLDQFLIHRRSIPVFAAFQLS